MSQLLKRKQESGLCLNGQDQPLSHEPDEGAAYEEGTYVLMGELAGLVVPAAFRGQPVDEVVLVESILQLGKNQMTEVPDGLDVGLGVPEGRGRRRDWS